MANVDRVKRQLLHDLVQQNVDLAEGRLPRDLAQAAPLDPGRADRRRRSCSRSPCSAPRG